MFPWLSTRHVSSWRWRNPPCTTTSSVVISQRPGLARTIFFSRMNWFIGANQAGRTLLAWLLKNATPPFMHHTNGKRWRFIPTKRLYTHPDAPLVWCYPNLYLLAIDRWESSRTSVMYGREKVSLIQTHLLFFRSYITELLFQWHTPVTTTSCYGLAGRFDACTIDGITTLIHIKHIIIITRQSDFFVAM